MIWFVVGVIVGGVAGAFSAIFFMFYGSSPPEHTAPLSHGIGTLFHRDNVPEWRLRTGSRFEVVYIHEDHSASVVSYVWTGATWVEWRPA